MSSDFEWRTDDNAGWEVPPEDGGPDGGPDFGGWLRRWWRWLGMAAVLLLVVGLVVYGFLDRRVEESERNISADVLAAHSLVRQAARERDFDLLAAMIGDDSQGWGDVQLDLLNINLFLDRRPLGLAMEPQPVPAGVGETITVTLSPDLQTAEVVELIPYEVVGSEGVSETIVLEHLFRYQKQGESWLLTKPPGDESFWGGWENFEAGEWLTLIYSEREGDFAPYLGRRLNDLVGDICSEDDIACPTSFKLQIRLTRDSLGLKAFNESYYDVFLVSNSSGQFHYSFPSAVLIGRPVSEAGYEALYRGYAGWLAGAMVFRYSVGQNGSGRDVRELLAEYGLEPPPQPVQELPIPGPVVSPPIPFPEQDILMACSDFTLMALMRYDLSANRWLDELSRRGGRLDFEDDHSLSLLTQLLQFFSGPVMTVLPDDSGVLFPLNRLNSDAETFELLLWQDGEEHLWLENDHGFQMFREDVQRQFDPNGRYLVLNETGIGQDGNGMMAAPRALDLNGCREGACELLNFSGFPFWSPDWSWTLIFTPGEERRLVLRENATGEEVDLGDGFFPAWVDEGHFIYSRVQNREEPGAGGQQIPGMEIVTASVNAPLDRTVLVDSVDIAAAVEVNISAVPLGVSSVIVHPEERDWFFMVATLYPEDQPQVNYLLTFNRRTEEVTKVLDLGKGSLMSPMRVVADGRYLAMGVFGPPAEGGAVNNRLILVPLEQETMAVGSEIVTYGVSPGLTHDWSEDGRWLLLVEQDNFRLVAPGYGYDQEIRHENDACSEAVWVDER